MFHSVELRVTVKQDGCMISQCVNRVESFTAKVTYHFNTN